jgi:hypothetical protein
VPRHHRRAGARPRTLAAAAILTLLGVITAGQGVASATTPRAITAMSVAAAPSWWSGICDATNWNARAAAAGWHGAGAHPLGASYLGVAVCGPRPSVDGAPNVLWKRPGWGELEFQCVELAMRFMAQVYGVSAYDANGDSVVRNYQAADGGGLVKVSNGTVGIAPQPGDVISFDSPGLGHVGVVAASNVDASGDGSITMLSQNDTSDGWRTLNVARWRVAGFGSYSPYGWLHDPAGRGARAGVARGPGYWMVDAGGGVYAFGGVAGYGPATIAPVAMAARRDGDGYWLTSTFGDVLAFGRSAAHGDRPTLLPGEHVTTMSATPSGNGYWLFTNLGRVFPFGDARFFGDMRGVTLDGPVIASVATPSGRGYYMVGSDGGVFAFGDARFYGSTGGMRLDRPVVGISPAPGTDGYWLVASDGGVFAFDTPFRGSMGGKPLNQPVNGLIAYGNGYLMVASDGGIFDFSNQPFAGSLGANPPRNPIVAVAAFDGN